MSAPVRLRFQPQGLPDRARYALVGRPLLWRCLRQVARLPELTPERRDAVHKQLSRRLLRHLGVHSVVRGEQLAQGGPYLIASLHEGIIDPLVLAQLPLRMRFLARDEIFSWPGVGAAITRLGHLRVDPERGAASYRGLLRGAAEVLGGGESLVVFPQGSVLGIEIDFQAGVFALARSLGVPVLPVVLTGTHRVWTHPFGAELRYGQPVGLQVLPPLDVARPGLRDLHAVRVELRRAMKAVALGGELPPPRRYVPQRDGFWDGFRFDIDPDFAELAALVAAHRGLVNDAPA